MVGRAREGEGRHPRRAGGAARREKVILAVESGYRESTESCATILRDLKRRGLAAPSWRSATAPRDLGRACRSVPGSQRAAVLEPSAPKYPGQAAAQTPGRGAQSPDEIPYAETPEAPQREKRALQAWATKRGHAEVGARSIAIGADC